MRKSGFTIIELLVVISIIGLLASIVVVALVGPRSDARDTKRIADLNNIRTALELYYNKYDYYPPSPCGHNCNGYYYSTSGDNWIPGLEEFTKLSKDPINNAPGPWEILTDNYSYAYGNVGRKPPGVAGYPNAGDTYDLTARLEKVNHPLSCNNKCYRYYFDDQAWCATGVACVAAGVVGSGYSTQIYEAGPTAAGN